MRLAFMRRLVPSVLLLGGALLGAPACEDEAEPLTSPQTFRVRVVAVNGADPPAMEAPLPANTGDTFETWEVEIQAVNPDGSDANFDGLVNLRVQPGAVVSVVAPDGENLGKNLRLSSGVGTATVTVTAVYGPARLWVEDLGYEKAPEGVTPLCANGINDDPEEDVLVDFPSDPGCAFADDHTETGGTFAAGASPAVHYELPSIQDIQGTGSSTPYPFESISVNTKGEHVLIVSRYSKDGFYVTDLVGQPATCTGDDSTCGPANSGLVCNMAAGGYCLPGCRGTGGNGCQQGGGNCSSADERIGTCAGGPVLQPGVGFNHLFVFTFSTPGGIRPCDRVTYLSGTLSEFFGFTELNFPSFNVDPLFEGEEDRCRIPEPIALSPPMIKSPVQMEQLEAALVRVKGYRVSSLMGPKPAFNNAFFPDQTNCDLNGDGKVDFENDSEASCGNACSADPECSEWTGYVSRGNYKAAKTCGPVCTTTADCGENQACDTEAGLCIRCPAGVDCTGFCMQSQAGTSVILVNTDGAPQFNPVANRGRVLESVTGSLRNFSGGSLNWTVEARCVDDVVCQAEGCSEAIKGTKESCLDLRTATDNEQGTN